MLGRVQRPGRRGSMAHQQVPGCDQCQGWNGSGRVRLSSESGSLAADIRRMACTCAYTDASSVTGVLPRSYSRFA